MMNLRAFTLLELLIGMIISGVVISSCYIGYSMVNDRYKRFSTLQKEEAVLMRFNSILNNDVIQSETILGSFNQLSVCFSDKKIIEYTFDENGVLRRDLFTTDTFSFPVINWNPLFYSVSIQNHSPLISEFSFSAIVHNDTLPFYYTKEYDAKKLLSLQLIQWDR